MSISFYSPNPPSSYLTFNRRLAFLEDINLSNPTNGQVLAYNSTTGRWANSAGGGGGGAGSDSIGSGNSLISTATTTGYSGGATVAEQDANGGIVLNKNFAAQDGTGSTKFSQALVFGDKTTNGSWRMIAYQDTAGTQDTSLSVQVLRNGAWVSMATWDKKIP